MRTKSVHDKQYAMRLVDPCDLDQVRRTKQQAPGALLLHIDAKGQLELVGEQPQAAR
jgi:hypothetical protein